MCTTPYSLFSEGSQNRLLFSLHSSLQKSLHSRGLQLSSPLWDSRGTSDPRGEEVFDGSSLLTSSPLNDPDTPTLLHHSCSSCFSPNISFAPASLAFSCSWEVLQDLGSDHLPIFLSVSLYLRSFTPTSVPLLSTFRKLSRMTLPSTLIPTVLLQRHTHLFLFFCCCSFYHSGTECGQISHSFRPHQTPS